MSVLELLPESSKRFIVFNAVLVALLTAMLLKNFALLGVAYSEVCARRALLFELLMVVNPFRPFTATVDEIERAVAIIDEASGMGLTGIVGNPNLIDETTTETVLEGYEILSRVARGSGPKVRFVSVRYDLADEIGPDAIDAPVLRIERHLVPPFRRRIRKSPLYTLG